MAGKLRRERKRETRGGESGKGRKPLKGEEMKSAPEADRLQRG